MKLTNQQKNIEIILDSYEFPFDADGLKEDNNWINVKVICEDEIVQENGIAPCLLTWELQELLQSLNSYLAGDITTYTSTFLEPNLQLRLQPYENEIATYISFLIPHHNEPFVFVKRMQKTDLVAFVEDLKKQSENFPIR